MTHMGITTYRRFKRVGAHQWSNEENDILMEEKQHDAILGPNLAPLVPIKPTGNLKHKVRTTQPAKL